MQIEALGGTGRALGSPGTALGGSDIHFQQRIYILYKYLVFRKYIVCFLKIYCLTRRFSLPLRCIDFMFCKCTCSGLIGILVQAQVMILWDFLNTLTKFLSAVWVSIGSIVCARIFKVKFFKINKFGLTLDCIGFAWG